MSPFVVFVAQPQSECTEQGREHTPAFAQYPDDSDAHWLLFEHEAPTTAAAPLEHATTTTATKPTAKSFLMNDMVGPARSATNGPVGRDCASVQRDADGWPVPLARANVPASRSAFADEFVWHTN